MNTYCFFAQITHNNMMHIFQSNLIYHFCVNITSLKMMSEYFSGFKLIFSCDLLYWLSFLASLAFIFSLWSCYPYTELKLERKVICMYNSLCPFVHPSHTNFNLNFIFWSSAQYFCYSPFYLFCIMGLTFNLFQVKGKYHLWGITAYRDDIVCLSVCPIVLVVTLFVGVTLTCWPVYLRSRSL